MKSEDVLKPDNLSLPQQNYVEVIAELVEKHGHAHPSEIARLLNVKKPSVTEAVSRLVDQGIARRVEQEVLLTTKGARIARDLDYRHESLRKFMVDVLEMESGPADEAACRIEHTADPEFIKRLLLLEEFMQRKVSPDCRKQWSQIMRDLRPLE